MMIDGKKIKAVLKAKHVKACVFAGHCGLTPSTVSAILCGYQPIGERTLTKLKRGLVSCGVTAAESVTLLAALDNNSEPSSNRWVR